MADHWTDRAPASVLEFDLDARGEPDPTSQDRRWLWRLENTLAVDAPLGSRLDQLGRDLRQYLNETCEHHWHAYESDEVVPAHRQCSWCNDVEWREATDGH